MRQQVRQHRPRTQRSILDLRAARKKTEQAGHGQERENRTASGWHEGEWESHAGGFSGTVTPYGPSPRSTALSTVRLPLGHGLRVDAVAPGQRFQSLLTVLDVSTHYLSRHGARVQNLSYKAFFHAGVWRVPWD